MSTPPVRDLVAVLKYPPRLPFDELSRRLAALAVPSDPQLVPVVPWLAFLGARARGEPWHLLVGKRHRPRVIVEPFEGEADPSRRRVINARCVLLHDGLVRGRVRIDALVHTLEGWILELGPLSSFEPFTIRSGSRPGARKPWFEDARDPWWHAFSSNERRRVEGEDVFGDELSFERWATAGLPEKAAEEAAALAADVRAPEPPQPAPVKKTPPKPAPVPAGQRSLF